MPALVVARAPDAGQGQECSARGENANNAPSAAPPLVRSDPRSPLGKNVQASARAPPKSPKKAKVVSKPPSAASVQPRSTKTSHATQPANDLPTSLPPPPSAVARAPPSHSQPSSAPTAPPAAPSPVQSPSARDGDALAPFYASFQRASKHEKKDALEACCEALGIDFAGVWGEEERPAAADPLQPFYAAFPSIPDKERNAILDICADVLAVEEPVPTATTNDDRVAPPTPLADPATISSPPGTTPPHGTDVTHTTPAPQPKSRKRQHPSAPASHGPLNEAHNGALLPHNAAPLPLSGAQVYAQRQIAPRPRRSRAAAFASGNHATSAAPASGSHATKAAPARAPHATTAKAGASAAGPAKGAAAASVTGASAATAKGASAASASGGGPGVAGGVVLPSATKSHYRSHTAYDQAYSSSGLFSTAALPAFSNSQGTSPTPSLPPLPSPSAPWGNCSSLERLARFREAEKRNAPTEQLAQLVYSAVPDSARRAPAPAPTSYAPSAAPRASAKRARSDGPDTQLVPCRWAHIVNGVKQPRTCTHVYACDPSQPRRDLEAELKAQVQAHLGDELRINDCTWEFVRRKGATVCIVQRDPAMHVVLKHLIPIANEMLDDSKKRRRL
ncbi:hypothetical protein HDZ31DRAFT_64611 [Schizophyllum fasciatum]